MCVLESMKYGINKLRLSLYIIWRAERLLKGENCYKLFYLIGLFTNHLQLFPITPVVHRNIYSTLTLDKWKMVIVLIRKKNFSKRSCWYKPGLFHIYIQKSLWSSVHTISTSYIHREQLSWIFWLKCSCWQSKPTLAEETLSHQKQCELFLHSKDVPE